MLVGREFCVVGVAMIYHDGYKPNTLARAMDSKTIHGFIAILVIVNAVVLGLMTYYKPDDLIYLKLEVIDQICLTVFVAEIMLRLLGHGFHYFRSGWNVFDFVIILGSLLTLPGGGAVLRSLRVFRLFYLIEISKKMRHILNGLAIAFSGIVHVVLLMVLVFYVYAIIGVSFFKHPEVTQFQDLSAAFHTLFQVLTGDDWYNVMRGVLPKYPHAWVYFYSYYLFMSFVILNFFIGVIVGAMQNAEDELAAEEGPKEDDGQATMQKALEDLRTEVVAMRKDMQAKAAAPAPKAAAAAPKAPASKTTGVKKPKATE